MADESQREACPPSRRAGAPRTRLAQALALVAALGCTSPATGEGAASATPAAPLACAELTTRTLEDVREVFGVIDTPPGGRASVAAELAGRILSLSVREGDRVEAGDLLCEIDGGPQSDAARTARARASEAEIAATNARVTRDRAAHLVERGIAARRDLEDAQSRLGELEAARDAARALASEAGRTAARARVTAPISGVVVRVIRRIGETVDGTPATPIVELADLRTLELVASVAPRDLLVLAPEQDARVTLDGLDEPLDAVVTRVGPALDPATGTGSVRLAVPGRESPLPLGLSGRASIRVGEHEAVVAPEGAVRGRRDGGMEVLVCRDGRAEAVRVEVGRRDGDVVELHSGAAAGDRVVLRALGIEEGSVVAGEGTEPPTSGAP